MVLRVVVVVLMVAIVPKTEEGGLKGCCCGCEAISSSSSPLGCWWLGKVRMMAPAAVLLAVAADVPACVGKV